jgi:hypothetical protein
VGGWRILHNEGLYNLHPSPSIVTVIISRRMRWVGHATCMGEMRTAHKFWLENLKGRGLSEDLGIGGRVVLEWILGK